MQSFTFSAFKSFSLVILSSLTLIYNSKAMAHINDGSYIENLKGAEILLQLVLNDPPVGAAFTIVETSEGRQQLSQSSLEQFKERFLNTKPVGLKIRVGALYVRLHDQDVTKDSGDGYEADEDIEIDPSRILKTVKIENISEYRNNSVVSFRTSSLGSFSKTIKSAEGKDVVMAYDVKLHFYFYDKIIGTEKYIDSEDSENADGSIKYKTRKVYLDDESEGHVIGDAKKFFENIIYFDLNSIPRRRL